MIDSAIFEKIAKLQEQNKLDKVIYTSCLLAIVGYDYVQDLSQTESIEHNKQKLDIDSFVKTVKETPLWGTVVNMGYFVNIPRYGKILPDVQQVRLLIDSLILTYKKQNIELPKGVHLTMPSSAKVIEGFTQNSYSDMNECINILDLFDNDNSDCYINELLYSIEPIILNLIESNKRFTTIDFNKLLKQNPYRFYLENSTLFDMKDGMIVDSTNENLAKDSLFNICLNYFLIDIIKDNFKDDKSGIAILIKLHKLENKKIEPIVISKNILEEFNRYNNDIVKFYLNKYFLFDINNEINKSSFVKLSNFCLSLYNG